MHPTQATGGEDLNTDLMCDVARSGYRRGTAAVASDDRSEVSNADFGDVVSNGNLFKLGFVEAHVDNPVENRNGGWGRSPGSDDVLDGTRHPNVRRFRQSVANDGGFECDNRTPGGDCISDFVLEGDSVGL
jgi:hypothetical protein